MKLTLPFLACVVLLSGSFCTVASASGPCYTVYGKKDAIVYRSEESPIDLSHSIRSGIEKRFPGGHLVMQSGVEDCPRVLPAGTQPNSFGVGPDDSPALRLSTPFPEVQAQAARTRTVAQRKSRRSTTGTTRITAVLPARRSELLTAAVPVTAPNAAQ